MKTVTLNSYSVFSIPFAGIHPGSGRIIRSDGFVLAHKGSKIWIQGYPHKAKNSSLTYMRVTLSKEKSKQKRAFMQDLVAETFLKNPDNKPTVDHKDRNTLNNDVFNLQFATYKEQAVNCANFLFAPPVEVRKERIKQRRREYYQANKERLKQKSREWYRKNREHCLELSREYHRRRHSS